MLTAFLLAATTCLGWDCDCCYPSCGRYYDCGYDCCYDSCWSPCWGCGYGGWYGGCCGPMWGGCCNSCWSGCCGSCGRKHCLKNLCQRIHQRHCCGMPCWDCGDCCDFCDEPCGFGCFGWGSVAGCYAASCCDCGSCCCGREHCLKHLCQRIRHRHDCCPPPCFLPCACPCDGNFDWDSCCCDECPSCGCAAPAAAPKGTPDLGAPPLAPKAPAPAPAGGGGSPAK